MAGLCHDLGHGPFSHMFDGFVIPRLLGVSKHGCGWSHEKGSQLMLEALVDLNGIDIAQEDLRQAQLLIDGAGEGWPFEIVSNSKTSLDVDKYDYFKRDSHYLGVKNILVDHELIMKETRIIDDRLSYPAKYYEKIFDVYQSRYKLFKNYYLNRKMQGIEMMIGEAMLLADPCYNFLEAVQDPARYLRLTDHILSEIEHSTDPRLEDSRAILKNIKHRVIYKYVAEKIVPSDTPLDEAQIAADIVSCAKDNGRPLALRDICVVTGNMNFSYKSRNPIDAVPFYNRGFDRHFRVLKEDISLLYSDKFS